MKKIFKYELPVKEKVELQLPKGAQIIRCEDVDGQFYIWAIVDPLSESTEARYFECYKTGQEIHTDLDHLVHIGNCKLFIMQELCLYVFENRNQYLKSVSESYA